jgi:hypothetical protein
MPEILTARSPSSPAAAGTPAAPVVRELPADEWPRLAALAPFDTGGLPDPLQWRIIVAEAGGPGGPIVAYCGLWTAIHCEPTWFAPEVRHHPKLWQDLWATTRGIVEDAGGQMVFATIDDDRPDLQTLWQKFGFVRAPGRLYVGDLDQLP